MYIFSKLKERTIRALYSKVSMGIKETPPVSNFCNKSNLVILSMVRSADIFMLLVAIKSFTRFVKLNHFVIVTDDDITEKDKNLLEKHLIKVKFISAAEIRHSELPKGGCWERLTAIAMKCKDHYVIQLDADTITHTNPEQVISCVENSTAFTLGTATGKNFVPFSEAVTFANNQIHQGNKHVQIVCESLLGGLEPNYSSYVRGCAGFAGFPKDSIKIEQLLEINTNYKRLIGKRWSEWGTEQFTSNLLVSNIEKKEVLSLDNYDTAPKGKCLGHYIGTMRFKKLIYTTDTHNFIKKLK